MTRKAEPERSCIVTREVKDKAELIRFVVSPDGVLVADLNYKLPGRGVYVTNSRLLVADAIARRSFSKAAKEPVTIPEGFLNQLEMLLAKRVGESLSLARKAGEVISGFEKVEDALNKGKVAALVHADDASEDGVRKLKREGIPVLHSLPRDLLSQVLGRENAVHVAVFHGPASSFFIETARRFALFME